MTEKPFEFERDDETLGLSVCHVVAGTYRKATTADIIAALQAAPEEQRMTVIAAAPEYQALARSHQAYQQRAEAAERRAEEAERLAELEAYGATLAQKRQAALDSAASSDFDSRVRAIIAEVAWSVANRAGILDENNPAYAIALLAEAANGAR